MKTGVPAMRTGVPRNENRFFPLWKTSQGNPCSGPVLALYRIAVLDLGVLNSFMIYVIKCPWSMSIQKKFGTSTATNIKCSIELPYILI